MKELKEAFNTLEEFKVTIIKGMHKELNNKIVKTDEKIDNDKLKEKYKKQLLDMLTIT